MPVPKRKRSRARKSKRNANKGFSIKAFTNCRNCQEVIGPHQACKSCGHYKGVKVLITKAERSTKRVELKQAKQARAPQAQPQPEEASAEQVKETK